VTADPVAIGIDIGGTNLRAARISASGEILERVSRPTTREPEAVVATILELVEKLDTPDVAAVGVGVPGRVDTARQMVLSGGYVDLASLDLAGQIAAATGNRVFIDNDANMALVAEMAIGAARGAKSVAMFTIGTGIGGAIAHDGRIFHGAATAGQLGHIGVEPGGQPCNCGGRGCVETTSSGSALSRLIAAADLPPETKADDLFRLRHEGDSTATGVLGKWATPLRSAVDTVAAVFDAKLILLGGGLGRAAHQALADVPAKSTWYRYDVRPAQLGDDAGVIGAGLAALASFAASPVAKSSALPAPPPAARDKSAILVNGVPASGKSSIAHAIAARTGWPVLALDSVKNPFLQELGGADRAFNRTLGRASYKAIWSVVRDAPAGSAFIIDAWFGFQPREVLETYRDMAGVTRTAEIWCHAPGETLAARYGARLDDRPAGHPGADYIPELIELAARAEPMRIGPVYDLDTTVPADADAIVRWVRETLGRDGA
jgi:glucokinase